MPSRATARGGSGSPAASTPAGLTSAWSAGAVTVGVPTFLSLDEAPAHVLWVTLADKSVSDVAALLDAREASA